MNDNKRYTAKITLRVSMDAYEEDDAVDVISDLFSPGEFCGLEIEKCDINSIDKDD